MLENDSQHHYGDSDRDGRFRANTSKYALMAAEDRCLRLAIESSDSAQANSKCSLAGGAHRRGIRRRRQLFQALFRWGGLAS